MAPGGIRTYSIYNNDDTTATQCGGSLYSTGATFYPTNHNTMPVKSAEELEVEAKEIERLESMMRESALHEDSKHVRQAREVHHARLAPVKHKKPHMNRKVMR